MSPSFNSGPDDNQFDPPLPHLLADDRLLTEDLSKPLAVPPEVLAKQVIEAYEKLKQEKEELEQMRAQIVQPQTSVPARHINWDRVFAVLFAFLFFALLPATVILLVKNLELNLRLEMMQSQQTQQTQQSKDRTQGTK